MLQIVSNIIALEIENRIHRTFRLLLYFFNNCAGLFIFKNKLVPPVRHLFFFDKIVFIVYKFITHNFRIFKLLAAPVIQLNGLPQFCFY